MGKPFNQELKRLPASLDWAAKVDIAPFAKFVAQAQGSLLVAVGAGGSFTTVELARLLHEERGGTALAHTPLSFIQSKTDLRHAYVVIFTASGNNRDVLATYEAAVRREPQGILVVCGRRKSKIGLKVADCERTVLFAERLPAGKDGYLATNSLAAFCALTIRAFGYDAPDAAQVIDTTDTGPRRWAGLHLPQSDSYYLALFGGWGRPAATDFESKLSEAGLGGVMLADYRHFAHGRHNWLDKRGDNTTVVAFLTPDSRAVAEKTLALLPASTRVIKLATSLDGPIGSMALLMDVYRLTALVGERVGIDPGRPGVPGYGRKIYHLGPTPGTRAAPVGVERAAIARKIDARGTQGNGEDEVIVAQAQRDYLVKFRKAQFGCLVADFDGTVVPPRAGAKDRLAPPITAFFEKLLRNHIPVYFATGRGDSIHQIIANSIDRKLHGRIFISYYNGGITIPLTEATPKPEGGPHHLEFEELLRQLNRDPLIAKYAKIENKSFQLTLRAAFPAAMTAIQELVARQTAGHFRVVQSSHSLDVIPGESTKLTAVRLAQSLLPSGCELLTVGDRGALFGNDYELLTHPYSLSVDMVSGALDSCWNLLPAGCRNLQGLLHYARRAKIKSRSFTLSIP